MGWGEHTTTVSNATLLDDLLTAADRFIEHETNHDPRADRSFQDLIIVAQRVKRQRHATNLTVDL